VLIETDSLYRRSPSLAFPRPICSQFFSKRSVAQACFSCGGDFFSSIPIPLYDFNYSEASSSKLQARFGQHFWCAYPATLGNSNNDLACTFGSASLRTHRRCPGRAQASSVLLAQICWTWKYGYVSGLRSLSDHSQGWLFASNWSKSGAVYLSRTSPWAPGSFTGA
jgi:hypothetical protein